MTAIYLDYNSTTPVDEAVIAAMGDVLQLQLANPASQHQAGQRARSRLMQEKLRILSLLNARTEGMAQDRLIVTSGGTESNNLAISGIARAQQSSRRSQQDDSVPRKILVSAIEHPCVLGAAEELERQGWQVESISVSRDGIVDIDQLASMMDDSTDLVSVMLANHETGVVQPVKQIAEICRRAAVPLHCDASQAIGKIDVDFIDLGVDALTLSPHKFYGPRGVGGLVVRHDLEIAPMMFGGFQQLGTRPGTEDIVLVAGMATALELAVRDVVTESKRIEQLRNQLEYELGELVKIQINGHSALRLPNTSNISFPGHNRQAVLMAADMQQIYVSSGSACASGSSEPSPVLQSMNLAEELIAGALRISLGKPTTADEIRMAVQRFAKIVGPE